MPCPPLAAFSDGELVQKLAAGENAAATELFRRHRSAMFGLSCRIARDPALAEDALQDACVRAWQTAERYDPARGSVLSWLLVITRGRTLDRVRSRQLRDGRIQASVDVNTIVGSDEAVDIRVNLRDSLTAIEAAMDVLPPTDRQTIELCYYEGLTHVEIAERLSVPLGTAKTALRRGMQTLRTAADDRPKRPFEWHLPVAETTAPLSGLQLLVVDDEKDTLKLTSLVLKRAGAIVIGAAQPLRALQRVESVWPDAALLDLEMPDLDGCGLIARLRAVADNLGRHLPAIAFSAHGTPADRHRARSAGFDLHLVKPIRPQLLVNGVASLLRA